tara:strand:- start:570 stop:1211 length:642 start_codon:yes stop_codon:yes gene_type:complete
MNIYQENTKIREDIIDGCGNWIWPKLDTGAWNGPSREWGEHHKPNVLKYVSNFTSVIQAGGNCGLYPRLYANMFKWVYTFEPEPMNFYCLVQNTQVPNIFKFNCALGDMKRSVSLNCAGQENVGTFTITEDQGNMNIPMMRIDDLFYDKVGLIHLDVEGYEEKILHGAVETIKEHRPVMMLECGRGTDIERFISDLEYEYAGQSSSDAIWIPR